MNDREKYKIIEIEGKNISPEIEEVLNKIFEDGWKDLIKDLSEASQPVSEEDGLKKD